MAVDEIIKDDLVAFLDCYGGGAMSETFWADFIAFLESKEARN